jgi:hypothetical protein
MNAALWFFDHGIGAFPIKPGTKEPACKWLDYTPSRAEAAGFTTYAVRLGLLAVADSDTPEAEAWNAAHLPDTPFKITTGPYHDGSPGRGRQRCYRLVGDAPHYFHRDGQTIEFRHRGQYCLGAGSRHPSGLIYTADPWSWDIDDVPFFPVTDFLFDDRPLAARGSSDGQPLVLPEVIKGGERHDTLHKIMRSLVANGVPLEGALKACHLENLAKCRPPLELDDKFLTRAYQQKDRANFVRSPKSGWALAGALIEIGLSVAATLVAVRSIDPAFDPETSE